MIKNARDKLLRAGIILSPIAFVWLCGERLVTARDPANFCLALRYGFDMAQTRPHAPGYPLLVLLWNIPYLLLQVEPFTALRIANCLFMVLAIALIGKTFELLWDKKGSLIVMILLATSPVFLYYGGTGEMYVFDTFISLAVFNAFFSGLRNRLPLYAFLLGLAGGFRQSSVIFLLPLVLVLLWSRRKELRLTWEFSQMLGALFACGVSAWFVPLIYSVGGLEKYWKLFTDAIELIVTPLQNISAILTYTLWILVASVGFILRKPRVMFEPIKKYSVFFIIWFVPALVFFIFRHYSKGYILIFAPMILLCVARWIEIYYPRNAMRVTLSIALVQLLLFFSVPFIQADSLPPPEKRSVSEHIISGLYRMVSSFAPTESHIRTSEDEIKESIRMVSANGSDSAIFIIDPSSDASIPRCLQELVPRFTYAGFLKFDSLHMEVFSGKDYLTEYAPKILFADNDLYVLCSPKSTQGYESRCGLKPLGIGKYVALFSIPKEKREIFRQFIMQTYFE